MSPVLPEKLSGGAGSRILVCTKLEAADSAQVSYDSRNIGLARVPQLATCVTNQIQLVTTLNGHMATTPPGDRGVERSRLQIRGERNTGRGRPVAVLAFAPALDLAPDVAQQQSLALGYLLASLAALIGIALASLLCRGRR